MSKQSGFTLIELMIVVAIIAILAAVALPAYRDYVTRAQVSEGFSLATSAKVAIATYYGEYSAYPNNNASAGMALPASIKGKYVSAVVVDNTGSITITYGGGSNAAINGQSMTMQATNNGGALNWTCSGLPRKYLPSNC
ncbi:pilin [Cognatilysobacter terrigena]|uniref:pilin n=1 Tax=Cognatilysobacter terrigena TaxID=2488749 RepID=UPI0010606C14|nr:pilin [Lysobacter terrigena]